VAAEEWNERVLVVTGDTAVAQVADPQAVVVRDAGDDDHAESFHCISKADFGRGPSPISLPVGGGADNEPQFVTAQSAKALVVEIDVAVAADASPGAHRSTPS
jgi:hypothetical protein